MTEQDQWIAMNDGVRLDATVLVPDGPAPAGGWPAVVLVHGHGDDGSKAMCLVRRGRGYAERGYLVVAYSVRGQGASEGLSFHLGARELFDLQDVVRWSLRELPIDRLGVVGSSQGGWHAWMAAAHCPEVAVAIPMNIFADYAEFAVTDGLLSKWFFTRTMRRRVLTAGLQDLARQWALAGEWDRLREWLRPSSPRLFAERIRCPVMVVHGWYDVGMPANEVLALFERLDVPKRLVIGGGGHDGQDDAAAEAHRRALEHAWLDRWLRDAPADGGAPIEAVVRPGWAHEGFQRLEGSREAVLHLRLGGRLDPQPATVACTHLNVHNRPTDGRYQLIDALADDLDGAAAAGPRAAGGGDAAPRLTLHTVSNRPGFQVHVDLYDVAPAGSATRISRGHHGTRRAEPGRHLAVEISLRTIAYDLAAGHHLRLVLANADPAHAFPFFEGFTARVLVDPAHPSRLTVPLA